MPMKRGDLVIICSNPHHPGAENIAGTVVRFRPREGFGGSDLVDVRYDHPRNGRRFTSPFGLSCLGPADPASLISLAKRYERLAAKLRKLAERKPRRR
jgi:hypothetical protein